MFERLEISQKERRQLAGVIDQRIAQIRRDKESAVDAEDYERAAALRADERQLIAQKASRQQGIDLQDGAA
jgi:UvrB/uvrC motif